MSAATTTIIAVGVAAASTAAQVYAAKQKAAADKRIAEQQAAAAQAAADRTDTTTNRSLDRIDTANQQNLARAQPYIDMGNNALSLLNKGLGMPSGMGPGMGPGLTPGLPGNALSPKPPSPALGMPSGPPLSANPPSLHLMQGSQGQGPQGQGQQAPMAQQGPMVRLQAPDGEIRMFPKADADRLIAVGAKEVR